MANGFNSFEELVNKLESLGLLQPLAGVIKKNITSSEFYWRGNNSIMSIRQGTTIYKYKHRFYSSVRSINNDIVSLLGFSDTKLIIEIPKDYIIWNYQNPYYKEIFDECSEDLLFEFGGDMGSLIEGVQKEFAQRGVTNI